jgi:hypothetical protein
MNDPPTGLRPQHKNYLHRITVKPPWAKFDKYTCINIPQLTNYAKLRKPPPLPTRSVLASPSRREPTVHPHTALRAGRYYQRKIHQYINITISEIIPHLTLQVLRTTRRNNSTSKKYFHIQCVIYFHLPKTSSIPLYLKPCLSTAQRSTFLFNGLQPRPVIFKLWYVDQYKEVRG